MWERTSDVGKMWPVCIFLLKANTRQPNGWTWFRSGIPSEFETKSEADLRLPLPMVEVALRTSFSIHGPYGKAIHVIKGCGPWQKLHMNKHCAQLILRGPNIFWQLHFVESEYICHKTPWLLLWNWKLVSVGLLVAPDIQHEFACHALKYNLGLMCGLNMNNWLPRWMKE